MKARFQALSEESLMLLVFVVWLTPIVIAQLTGVLWPALISAAMILAVPIWANIKDIRNTETCAYHKAWAWVLVIGIVALASYLTKAAL